MNKQEIEKAICVMENLKYLLIDVLGNKNNEKVFDVAIEMLEKQLTNGWIPVEKELPKFTDDYLVSVTISTSFGDFDTVRTLPFYRRDGKGGWLLPENFDEVWKVRAWRNLPDLSQHKQLATDNNVVTLSPEEVQELKAERDYWEREAKKWCAKLGEIRLWIGGQK